MDKDARLGILASAILDGTPVDWPSVGSDSGPEEKAVVAQLQILAEIAALHRQLPDEAGTPGSATATQSVEQTRPAIMWGHLRLHEVLGRGTFGEVFRAWDAQLDRYVALKLLRAQTVSDDAHASVRNPQRVVHEGRLLARVRHPNVITVYGAETRDGTVGIWMEFIAGRTLHQIVDQQGPLSAREAAVIGIDLCHAVAAVHSAGLLHRDVTARNVMREDGGRIVLMDFGAGHEYQGTGHRGSDATGTPLYMAPELFSGGTADQRTEIYAVGVLLYHLVTGSYPVIARSLGAVGEAHRKGERTRLRDARADLPAPFVHAIEQAIAPDPGQRFQTAGEFDAALEHAVRTGREVGPAPAVKRRVWLLAAAVIAGVVSTITSGTRVAGPDQAAPAAPAAAGVIDRKLAASMEMSLLSNPSDDGRYVAGLVNATGDAAILDLATGKYEALGVGRGDFSDGYASLTALSPDGRTVAVNWWNNDETGSMVLARLNGSHHRVAIDGAVDVYPHQFSQDGSLVVTLVTDANRQNRIALVATADGAVRNIKSIGNVSPERLTISPDGRYLAYDHPQSAGSRDRDIVAVDTHTGSEWLLVDGPTDDSQPIWAPDGRHVLFFSDRSRARAAWVVPVEAGRASAAASMVKDDVTRIWPRGFTKAGALHYQLASGFAEAYIGAIDGSAPPEAISSREPVSNFYPVWSPDGRFLVYTSERRPDQWRAPWIYDTATRTEEPVPVTERLGLPFGWSPDGTRIVTAGPGDDQVFVVDRRTGAARQIGRSLGFARWTAAGIVYRQAKAIVVVDADGRRIRTVDFTDPAIAEFGLGLDGRSALALWKTGRITAHDTSSGATREWHDAEARQLPRHAVAPHLPSIAYVATGKDTSGEFASLKVWPGSGDPRELLRVRAPERLVLAGWTADGANLLALRWDGRPLSRPDERRARTLWRVPVHGGTPVATSLSMDALRDISLHPDGRRIAFNAGFKLAEHWVLENLLPAR